MDIAAKRLVNRRQPVDRLTKHIEHTIQGLWPNRHLDRYTGINNRQTALQTSDVARRTRAYNDILSLNYETVKQAAAGNWIIG